MTTSVRSDATKSVVVVNGLDALTVKETGVVTAGAAGVSGNDVATVGQLGLSGFYQSPEQTITGAGLLTLAHGLSKTPLLITYTLICKTAEGGYSVGDTVGIDSTSYWSGATVNSGLVCVPDATNLTIRYGSTAAVFHLLNKTTGAGTAITPANWRLVVRAWA